MTPIGLTVRTVRRGAVVITAGLAFFVYFLSVTYGQLYKTQASRDDLVRQFSHNQAFAALFGQAVRLDTAGGFLMWKYGAIFTVLIALWSMFSVTKVLRGDEELGRTDLLVSGPVNVVSQVLRQTLVLMGVLAVLALVMALGGVAGGLPVGGSLLMGVTMVSCGWVFGAVAAVTSQLVSSRRQASSLAGALMGAAFLTRVLATGSGRYWLCWCTPFGWAERLSPFSDPKYVALVPIAVTPVLLMVVALRLRAGRDTGEGTLRATDRHRSAVPLRTVHGLDWRLSRDTAAGWATASVLTGFVLGYLAIGIADYVRSDANVEKLLAKYTNSPVSSLTGFLGYSLSLVAVVLSVFAGTIFARAREEEALGHGDLILTAGVSRVRTVGSRVVLCIALVVVLALTTAGAAWAGTALGGGAPADFGRTMEGGLNIVPLVLLFGSLALLTFGLVPRATGAVRFASVGLAYGILFLGGALKLPRLVRDLSPFTHLAPVPAGPANLEALLVMTGLAVACGLVGLVAFTRRDVMVE